MFDKKDCLESKNHKKEFQVPANNIILVNKTNFFNIVQNILEKYYLQPMHGPSKSNLKDGFIEREIHGAMHASRAAIWAMVMNNFLKKITPVYMLINHLNL